MLTPQQIHFFEKKQSFPFFYGRSRKKELKELFSKHFTVPAPKDGRLNVLDIGFGKVAELYALMDHLPQAVLVGMEVYDKKIKSLARELKDLGNMRVVRGDLDALAFEEEYFDCVFAFNVLPFSSDPVAALTGIHRILKKKASFVFSIDSKGLEKYLSTGISVKTDPPSEWEKRAQQAGFKIQKTYTSQRGVWYAICIS